MVKKKVAATRWHDGVGQIEDLSDVEQAAHAIVTERRDLEPSVGRIIDAESLDDEQRLVALNAFHASLSDPDDENRNPMVAIANAGG
ncbi:MAG: hypothetical protein AB8G26_16455 [Ilumatobacter sp.]